MGDIFVTAATILVLFMCCMFIIGLKARDNSLMDIAYGPAFLFACWGAWFLIGFLFEVISDWQLTVFKRGGTNKGKIIMHGLWRYSRHPNYFGEATLWWGIFFIGLAAPFGLFGLISPLTISFLLLKVSGIPMLEVKYLGNQEFEAYKARTSGFFPWFERKTDIRSSPSERSKQ